MATRQAQRIKEQVQRALERDEPETARQAILDEASELTHSSRNAMYGNPEDNFRNIAAAWNAYISALPYNADRQLTSNDVAVMMILMKTARLATNPNHHDSCVDIAGYAACLGDIQAAASGSYSTTGLTDGMAQVNTEFQQKQTNATAMKGSLRR